MSKRLLPLLALLSSGCCLGQVCDYCPFPIWLYVVDAGTDAAIPQATLVVDAPTCTSSTWQGEVLQLSCPLDENHDVTLSAEGYLPQTLTVWASSAPDEGCCACGFELAEYDVGLETHDTEG